MTSFSGEDHDVDESGMAQFPRVPFDADSETTIIIGTMPTSNRIVLDPAICHGKPIVAGTRVPVTVVVGSLAGGMTMEEVQREYDLTADDVRAALRYVGELAEHESVHRLPAA